MTKAVLAIAGILLGLPIHAAAAPPQAAAKGMFRRIDIPGSLGTDANAINAGGEIVGYYVDSALTGHGYLRIPHD